MVFLYKTNVFWMPLDELKQKETLWHLDKMLEIFCGNGITELYFDRNASAEEPYEFLIHEIIEQMLSIKAGNKIYSRLLIYVMEKSHHQR